MTRLRLRVEPILVGFLLLGIPLAILAANWLTRSSGEWVNRSTPHDRSAAETAADHLPTINTTPVKIAPNAPASPGSPPVSPGAHPASPGPTDDALVDRGRLLHFNRCAICHGESGDGAGPYARMMSPRPRDFRKGKFRLTTTQNQIPTDDDLRRAITHGIPGSTMPAWSQLTGDELDALVAFIRATRAAAVRDELDDLVAAGEMTRDEADVALAERTVPGPPIVVPPEPVFDAARQARARRIYLEACAACHGADGHPNPDAVKLDDDGLPDPPRTFISGIFKGGLEGRALYCRIAKGMRGTPMAAFEGIYTPQEIWDLVHYVQLLARTGTPETAAERGPETRR